MLSPRSNGLLRAEAAPLAGAQAPLGDVQPSRRGGSAQSAADRRGPVGVPGLLAELIRAGELMDEASDLAELWTVVAIEAARMLGTGARTMAWAGRHWVILADSEGLARRAEQSELDLVHIRSVLVTIMDCTVLQAPTRLVWTSAEEDAFVGAEELAGQYTRFAAGAVRRLHSRTHLQRALTARNRIGQAQGILMTRHQVSAAEAFDALNRRSQDTNVKLRVLADEVIRTGDLAVPSGARPSRQISWGRGRPRLDGLAS